MKLSKYTVFVFLLFWGKGIAFGELITYPGVVNTYMKESAEYSVRVAQNGVWQDVFTYYSRATWQNEPKVYGKNGSTSHASFSFDGVVMVEVTKLKRSGTAVMVRPSSDNIVPLLSPDGKVATFTIGEPGQFSVEFEDIDSNYHPVYNNMLIFANPLEDPAEIPSPGGPWYFGPGFHTIGVKKSVPGGTTIYIAGGAVVRGTFFADSKNNIKVLGRGIITGAGISKADDNTLPFDDSLFPGNSPPISSITNKHNYNLINFDGNCQNITVKGVTFTDPPHFAILIRGRNHHVENVKTIGWYKATDGVGVGRELTLKDSFFKASDDCIKLYGRDTDIDNCITWATYNGAAFQFSWGSGGQTSNVDVNDCDVIHYRMKSSGNWSAGTNMNAGNKAVFSSMHDESADYSNYNFTDIRVEGKIMRLIGLYNNGSGSIRDVHFKNIFVDGPVQKRNFLDSKNLGGVDDFLFENLYIAGKRIDKSNGDPQNQSLKLDIENATNINYASSPFNRKPGIEQIPIVILHEDETSLMAPTHWDDDGDSLTFSSPNLPAFGALNTNTGAITFFPGSVDIGNYYGVELVANDGNGGVFSVYFDIRVLGPLVNYGNNFSNGIPSDDFIGNTSAFYIGSGQLFNVDCDKWDSIHLKEEHFSEASDHFKVVTRMKGLATALGSWEGASVRFRDVGSMDWYELQCRTDSGNDVRIYGKEGGEVVTPLIEDLDINPEVWNVFSLSVSGNNVDLYHGNHFVGSAALASTTGRVGFRQRNGDAWWDYFRVVSSGEPDYREGFDDALAEGWNYDGDEFHIVDIGGGDYVLKQVAGNWSFATYNEVVSVDRNFRLSVDGRVVGTRTNNYDSPIVVVKYKDNNNWITVYIVQNVSTGVRDLILKKKIGGTVEPLVTLASGIVSLVDVADWHTIEVKVDSDNLSVWVNNTQEVSNYVESDLNHANFDNAAQCGVRSQADTVSQEFNNFVFYDEYAQ